MGRISGCTSTDNGTRGIFSFNGATVLTRGNKLVAGNGTNLVGALTLLAGEWVRGVEPAVTYLP